MDKQTLLTALAGTLSLEIRVRKDSERQLQAFEAQPGFTAYLLDLILEPDVVLGIQISASILFKNRVDHYWVAPESKPSLLLIREDEKPGIKDRLITTIIKTHRNKQIKLQLAAALHCILDTDKWEGLSSIIKNLLSDSSNVDHVYTGLICVYEYTRIYRWSSLETSNTSNPVLEEVAQEIFPLLEPMASQLVTNSDTLSYEMLYLIVKTFKFTTFSSLPSYFQDANKLGNWCQLQLYIINEPLPAAVLEEDSVDIRVSHPRVKTVKWCFANLHRLLARHGGGFNTKQRLENKFAQLFMDHFVPQILSAYWQIIEKWSTKSVWLSEASLYHMISFLEQLIDTPAWSELSSKLEAIINHIILPTLSASNDTIELYQDEPEEYIRQFFDINRESDTADVASINFVFRLSATKFKATIDLVLSIVNSIFQKRASDRDNLEYALQTEGALRILSTLSYKLDKKTSPVHGQLDQLLYTFVYPELSAETMSKFPFLSARACDTLAMFVYKYQDQKVLEDIFQGVVACFHNDAQFPIQLTAVDALRTLVDEEAVAAHISSQAPQLMGTLLEMSKKFESDILTSVMDSFVEKFAKDLEPYAQELSSRLVEQFLKLAHELLELQTGTNKVDIEKEYQAMGILNTLTTLVIAMNASPAVAASMEPTCEEMIKFVLENAMVSFLSDAIEILESILFATQQVSPVSWSMFQTCIESFDTYALEFFDSFQPFFDSIINFGFTKPDITIESPYVQSMLTGCFKVLNSDSLDRRFCHKAFELIELTIISMNTRFVDFLPRFLPSIFSAMSSLEAQDAFDGHMLHHLSILRILFACLYIDPNTTLHFLHEVAFIGSFFSLWHSHSDSFQSVYGCKLQILACLAILCDSDLSLVPADVLGGVADILVANLEVLPHAIKARQEILSLDREMKALQKEAGNLDDEDDEDDEYSGAYLEDEYEADEAELEALKQTPLDPMNVFEVFANKFTTLQLSDVSRHTAVFGSLDSSQQETITRIVKISQHGVQGR